MSWAYDDPRERQRVEAEFLASEHQRYIDEHPDFLPGCQCHQLTREARLFLADPRTLVVKPDGMWFVPEPKETR